jgi:hypothetical protein
MAKPIDQDQAAALWEQMGVTVDKLRLAPRQHKGNVIFCGYADIQIWMFHQGVAIPFITLTGNSIKLMGDQIHFDPKSERGKGTRSGDFFPHWYPVTPAARAVLTRKLQEIPQVIAMVEQAVSQLSAAAGAAAR